MAQKLPLSWDLRIGVGRQVVGTFTIGNLPLTAEITAGAYGTGRDDVSAVVEITAPNVVKVTISVAADAAPGNSDHDAAFQIGADAANRRDLFRGTISVEQRRATF